MRLSHVLFASTFLLLRNAMERRAAAVGPIEMHESAHPTEQVGPSGGGDAAEERGLGKRAGGWMDDRANGGLGEGE
jgi:hypothetical protein